MDVQAFSGFSHSLQTIAVAVLIFAACTYLPKLNYKAQISRLPIFGDPTNVGKQRQNYMMFAKKMYDEAYIKFQNSAYLMPSPDGEDRIVVPPSLLSELRKVHDDFISFPKAIDNLLETKYTNLETDVKVVIQSIKADLTPALARLNETIGDAVGETLRELMPACDDWTEVYVNDKTAQVVAKVSGRIFIGPEAAQDPEYLDCATNYTFSIVACARAVHVLRPWLKPLQAPFLSKTRMLRKYEYRTKNFIRPIIKGRLEAEKDDPNYQAPDDMLSWLLKRMEHIQDGEAKLNIMVKWQLGLIMAAVHTTSMTLTNVLYTLAVTPEYVEPLREEMRNVLAEHNEILNSKALQQLEKLDSYMKEVFRLYPPGITSFQRKVTKGFALSNGQYIPAGATLEIPTGSVYTDPANYPDPNTFDGFRHYKLRRGATSTDHARNQFVSINETHLGFGYGRHACPGRFFASNEIKLILVRMILDYDVKMPNGETERYPQIEAGSSVFPHPKKTLLFKKVEV